MSKKTTDCCKQQDCIFTDIICGKIDLKDNCFNTLWKAIGTNATITMKVENKSNCLMRLKIKGKKCVIVKVFPCKETSITMQNVDNVAVQCCCCSDTKYSCYGCYEICIHYISDLHKTNRHKCLPCNEIIISC